MLSWVYLQKPKEAKQLKSSEELRQVLYDAQKYLPADFLVKLDVSVPEGTKVALKAG